MDYENCAGYKFSKKNVANRIPKREFVYIWVFCLYSSKSFFCISFYYVGYDVWELFRLSDHVLGIELMND